MKTDWKMLIALGAVVVGGAGCDNSSSSATMGQSTVEVLSDAESASVLARLNAGQVETAQVLMPLGAHSDVLGLAQRMIDVHTRIDGMLLATGVAEQPNSVAQALDSDAATLIALMTNAGAVQAEPIYVNSQVAHQRQLLLLIDCAVLPGTTNDGFRNFVFSQVRPQVKQNLELAAEVQAKLSNGSGGGGFAGAVTAAPEGDRCADACDPQLSTGFSVELRSAACR